MKLHEILNTAVDFEVLLQSRYEFQTAAKIGPRNIFFTALNNGGSWEVSFKEVDATGKSSHGVTGKGHELEVFSMVKDSILHFVDEYNPSAFHFSAEKDDNDRDTRANLYDRLVRRLAIPNYKWERSKEENRDFFNFVRVA